MPRRTRKNVGISILPHVRKHLISRSVFQPLTPWSNDSDLVTMSETLPEKISEGQSAKASGGQILSHTTERGNVRGVGGLFITLFIITVHVHRQTQNQSNHRTGTSWPWHLPYAQVWSVTPTLFPFPWGCLESITILSECRNYVGTLSLFNIYGFRREPGNMTLSPPPFLSFSAPLSHHV